MHHLLSACFCNWSLTEGPKDKTRIFKKYRIYLKRREYYNWSKGMKRSLIKKIFQGNDWLNIIFIQRIDVVSFWIGILYRTGVDCLLYSCVVFFRDWQTDKGWRWKERSTSYSGVRFAHGTSFENFSESQNPSERASQGMFSLYLTLSLSLFLFTFIILGHIWWIWILLFRVTSTFLSFYFLLRVFLSFTPV